MRGVARLRRAYRVLRGRDPFATDSPDPSPQPETETELLPEPEPPRRASMPASLDTATRLDHETVFVAGWLWDPDHETPRLLWRPDEAADWRPLTGAARVPRSDLRRRFAAGPTTDAGFVACVRLEDLGAQEQEIAVGLGHDDEDIQILGPCEVERIPPFTGKARLLEMFPSLCANPASLEVLEQAMSRTLRECARARRVAASWSFGPAPTDPTLSIVVPLYGALDVLESQIAEFCADTDLCHEVELIYVLDDPSRTEELRHLSQHLWHLYQVPCRFLALADNSGFGGATNEGVRHATGEFVLLLNSDVVPARPGWSGALVEALRGRPEAGLLAPKLLFEDGSLQHAGLYFAPSRLRVGNHQDAPCDVDVWKNHQYFKGFPRAFAPADQPRRVPAVSAACLLLRRALFDELGGFDETYVHGDCEDTDLCLRVAARGLEIWYEPDVELYHLEAQSYPDHLRHAVTGYNNWLQDRRWHDAMVERMSAFPLDPP